LALAGLLLALSFDTAAAQQSNAQNVLRQACGRDFMTYCSGVQRGSGQVVACLRQNMARLSPTCQQALVSLAGQRGAGPPPAAVAPPPAAAVAPRPVAPPATTAARRPGAAPTMAAPTDAQIAQIHRTCAADFAAKCTGVPPGGGEAIACLLRNADAASPACQDAMAVLPPPTTATTSPATRPGATRPPPPPVAMAPPPPPRVAPPPPPYPPPVAALPPPPPVATVLRICDADRRKLCGGVVPGDANVIACLAQAVRVVSRPCRQALAHLRR
jgi:hypothetical protein